LLVFCKTARIELYTFIFRILRILASADNANVIATVQHLHVAYASTFCVSTIQFICERANGYYFILLIKEGQTFPRVFLQRIRVVDPIAVLQPAHETLAVLVEADE
jgi:hypothetical protein